MHPVKRIFAMGRSSGESATVLAMMDQQESVRRLVAQMVEDSGLDLSSLARRAGLSPSTLTRFMNSEVKHVLSTKTLAKISDAIGVPPPTEAPSVLPRAIRVEALSAVARALGLSSADLAIRDKRTLEWLDVIGRIPARAENHAFELLRGLAEGGNAPEKDASPSEPGRVRREG